MKTKIFLDSGDPEETKQAIELLGFLDGQTTNPSLIAKSPQAQARIAKGDKFSKEEIKDYYKETVKEVARLIPDGSVSIEVYADKQTSPEAMFAEAKEMNTWIDNAHIKYPILNSGLAAAKKSIQEGMRINMTLCFTQEQAAAVYAASRGAGKGDAFISPFVGRLDDQGLDGMDLIKNIAKMYQSSDGHVETLVASIRTLDHLLYSLALGVDIVTVPFKILQVWAEQGMEVPDKSYVYKKNLARINYQNIVLDKKWSDYNIFHEMTDIGIDKFAQDWQAIIK